MYCFQNRICVIVMIFLLAFIQDANSMHLPMDSKVDGPVSHYVDETGVKVERQIVNAVVVDSGYGNQTEPKYDGSDEYYMKDDEDSYGYSNPHVRDDESEQSYEDATNNDHPDDRKPNPSAINLSSPTNILDIFTALHTAWRAVEKHREEVVQDLQKSRNQSLDDDRLRRNSNLLNRQGISSNQTYFLENLHPLTPAPEPQTPTVPPKSETSVSEARYIKGDPLKGYYDFVITEGSYKFWAAFQLATAALVIYSTFAAIYYSKVNPIVGDYDYVDYLGGGRSLSDTNVDYQDPTDDGGDSQSMRDSQKNSTQHTETPSSWASMVRDNWIPKIGSTAKTILQLIDKLS